MDYRANREFCEREKVLYLKDIKKDMPYFGRSYSRAHYTVDIAGLGIKESAGKIISCLGTPENLAVYCHLRHGPEGTGRRG